MVTQNYANNIIIANQANQAVEIAMYAYPVEQKPESRAEGLTKRVKLKM